MTKYIVMLADKSGVGSYGIGTTEAEARANAKKSWPGGRVKETRVRTTDVPDGYRLVVHTLCNGVEWYSVPEYTVVHEAGEGMAYWTIEEDRDGVLYSTSGDMVRRKVGPDLHPGWSHPSLRDTLILNGLPEALVDRYLAQAQP